MPNEILSMLRTWLYTHPQPDRPFMSFMGKTLTPKSFLQHIEENTYLGATALHALTDGGDATEAIQRMIDANQAGRTSTSQPG